MKLVFKTWVYLSFPIWLFAQGKTEKAVFVW